MYQSKPSGSYTVRHPVHQLHKLLEADESWRTVHFSNVVISGLIAKASPGKENPCTLYFLNILIDTYVLCTVYRTD